MKAKDQLVVQNQSKQANSFLQKFSWFSSKKHQNVSNDYNLTQNSQNVELPIKISADGISVHGFNFSFSKLSLPMQHYLRGLVALTLVGISSAQSQTYYFKDWLGFAWKLLLSGSENLSQVPKDLAAGACNMTASAAFSGDLMLDSSYYNNAAELYRQANASAYNVTSECVAKLIEVAHNNWQQGVYQNYYIVGGVVAGVILLACVSAGLAVFCTKDRAERFIPGARRAAMEEAAAPLKENLLNETADEYRIPPHSFLTGHP